MPERNTALTRSLRALAHPITIGAVILLLVNDHLLRVMWPSWWTGKLGDFAWLAFFPAVLAVPLALIVPARVRRQESIVAGLAFGITGAMFAAMKTIPAVMEAGLWVLRQISGGPVVLRVDPTDLLALPGMGIGWWVWRQSGKPAPVLRGWAILAMGALATMANMPPPELGVVNLRQDPDGSIFAYSTGKVLLSDDGGLTWSDVKDPDWEPMYDLASPHDRYEAWILVDGSDPSIQYRFTPEQSIERSSDGGVTWHEEVDARLSEAQAAFVQARAGSYAIPGPYDALIDTEHKTVVVTMGAQGLLTRRNDGTWHWTTITANEGRWGFERASDLHNVPDVARLLIIELLLAIDLVFLITTLIWDMSPLGKPSTWHIIGLIPTCGLWVIIVLIRPEMAHDTELLSPFLFVALLLGILYAANAIIQMRYVGIAPLPAVWKPATLIAALFIAPYILWSQSILPDYGVTQIIVIFTTGAGLIAVIHRASTLIAPPPESAS